jgi:hypothetical protein
MNAASMRAEAASSRAETAASRAKVGFALNWSRVMRHGSSDNEMCVMAQAVAAGLQTPAEEDLALLRRLHDVCKWDVNKTALWAKFVVGLEDDDVAALMAAKITGILLFQLQKGSSTALQLLNNTPGLVSGVVAQIAFYAASYNGDE